MLGIALSERHALHLVNAIHRRLSLAAKRRFFHAFGETRYGVSGSWKLDFAGRVVLLPMRRDFSLSWQAATAFHGWDPEIHEFYERLLESPRPPRLVFDVGANYGSHTIRFLVHGIRVLSFEPNPACHAFFSDWCELNDVQPEIVPAAVGERPGTADLLVPAGAAYMGSLDERVKVRLAGRSDLIRIEVPVITLDDIVAERGLAPDLIKIDTEGNEANVLRGARRVLATARPLVVFEAWPDGTDRGVLFEILSAAGYSVEALRLAVQSTKLSRDAFLASPATNFVARPI